MALEAEALAANAKLEHLMAAGLHREDDEKAPAAPHWNHDGEKERLAENQYHEGEEVFAAGLHYHEGEEKELVDSLEASLPEADMAKQVEIQLAPAAQPKVEEEK